MQQTLTHPTDASFRIAVIGVTIAVTWHTLSQIGASLNAVETRCTALQT